MNREGLQAVADNRELVDRIRDALGASPSVREVKMFGGLSFMVNERMVVHVRSNHDLLVRADPERADALLSVKGARPAEMGAGRAMGKGWILVDDEAVETDGDLGFWIDVALDHNDRESDTRHRRRP